ncbi:DNA topoisomerase I [Candidatus Bathyarchaeota archaeon]|nr:DNA topoisomerase I [Candidatus Bathyarchaeota archaeon]
MQHLFHNGIVVPKYEWKRFSIKIRGKEVQLTPHQEEMAVAWVKKLGTEYVNDKVFVNNFFNDFREALRLKEKLEPADFDFSAIINYLEKEKAAKLSLSKAEKKRLAEERKKLKEAVKEKFGYAVVDGVKTEISNYVAEPSCIFMGRGRHPKRGCWKQGPSEEDIELNLSPDAPLPPGGWKRTWQKDVMWVARWTDKLSGKMKYVWLAESSVPKQMRDVQKFEKAKELQRNIERIKNHIMANLDSADMKRRKTATVCYLIDRFKIRVGDEKDPDEADTVGASTLRPEHIKFDEGGKVTLHFLGKDSVPHIFEDRLPENVIRNLKEFSANAKSTLFNGVDSTRVSEFLGEVVSGLSAKVFRTYYASQAVKGKLDTTPVKVEDPDHFKKYVATMANLEAAKTCNHKRKIPKTWASSLQKQEEKLRSLIEKSRAAQAKMQQLIKEKEQQFLTVLNKEEERLKTLMQDLEILQQSSSEMLQGKQGQALARRIAQKTKAVKVQRERIKRIKEKHLEQIRRLRQRRDVRLQRDRNAIERLRLQVEAKKKTRDFNLGTSLKSYIDPRIYYNWGKNVNYDWKLYYPKSLQKKFSWVENNSVTF